MRAARAVLATGAIGPVELVRTTWTSGYHRGRRLAGLARPARDGGGGVDEIATHHLDLCAHLLGEDLRITGASTADREVVHESAVLIARAAGALVTISTAQRTADSNEIEVVGAATARSRFSLYLADSLEVRRAADPVGPWARLRRHAEGLRGLPAAVAAARAGGDFLGSYAAHWEATAAALRAGSRPPATLDDGMAALSLALAAAEAASPAATGP